MSILILPTPLLTRYIIDHSIPEKNIRQLLLIVSVALVIILIQKIVGYFQGMLFYKINNRLVYDIRMHLLSNINCKRSKYLNKWSPGYLISRINDDTNRLRTLFADTFIGIIKDVLTFSVGFFIIFYLHWKLAVVTILLLPFFITSSFYFGRIIGKKSKIYYEDDAQTTKQLSESLSMIELIKVFNQDKYSQSRYSNKALIALKSNINLGRVRFINNAVIGFIAGLSPVILLAYGGYEIIQDRLTLGSLIAFKSFVGYLLGPTNRLINVNIQIQQSLEALKRVLSIFEIPEEVKSMNTSYGLMNKLIFKNIKFTYDDVEILKDISFSLQQGERVGIVGESGSGKTTLIRLLLGLYDIDSGSITIKCNDGNEITENTILALREKVALVEQEPFLFNDTIYENIQFGKHKATKQEIEDAVKLAGAKEFIHNLQDGYETNVGEGGTNLSVGQKQRIAIARAFVKKPEILVFDEATSNIDSISERHITNTIHNLSDDYTVFIISHRLNILEDCDKILVLDNGKIVESGSHQELIKKEGRYRAMYEAHQFDNLGGH
ncbi:MAG: ABC transporter ATP-binding protein [Bacteroidetes bacterium]|nr:ABC transporter ATP-binding protein [Bacteroidota bacterium]MBL7110228.1 ABC transporter ATP-binding protein [Candidatus Neomarinimicrobiota bacterium]